MKLLKSPAHYQASLSAEHKDSDAMRFGRVYDQFLLEQIPPTICPFDSFRSKEAREWRDTHTDYLKPSEEELMQDMYTAFMLSEAAPLIQGGSAQAPVLWTDEVTGVPCRALPDYLTSPVCYDLKTTNDASPEAFRYSCIKYGYDIQDAMYLDGLAAIGHTARDFVFVVQEIEAPYTVAMYRLSEESREEARMKYRDALKLYAKCQERDEWPGYTDGIEEIVI